MGVKKECRFSFGDFCAGIGGCRVALDKLGGKCVVYSEIDRDALMVYKQNFNVEGEMAYGDITKGNPGYLPNIDILVAGFPCQTFSVAGRGKGFEDVRGTLFFHIANIIKVKRPKAFLLENVKGLVGHDNGKTYHTIINLLAREYNNQMILMPTSDNLGYYIYATVLNSVDYGVPQNRERIYIVGFETRVEFRFPKGNGQTKMFKDIKRELADYTKYMMPKTPSREIMAEKERIIEDGGVAGTLTTKQDRWNCAGLVPHNGWYRFLTEREMARLQGFPDSYLIPAMTLPKWERLFGNAVTVSVVESIGREMLGALEIG